ncbi:MAG: L,D-transpeptidase [Beijerinckiaceae bacterium]|nr:L,D-transpeptidase [Beijerinckiaceae bacterium]MCI0736964.1 L,D-transpeptidase [Beijerinckiaceae bacterium]
MRGGILPCCTLLCAIFISPEALAVSVHIDLSSQTMHVRSASGSYSWPVSTARWGYSTPRGTYHAQSLQRMHYSRKYHMSPMPHSIFFAGGYAIHGTYETGSLGRPASHGCVRLSPGHAANLYQMVQAEGARITISGSPPHAVRYARLGRQGALAYAPGRKPPAMARSWQRNPVARPEPDWFAWQ